MSCRARAQLRVVSYCALFTIPSGLPLHRLGGTLPGHGPRNLWSIFPPSGDGAHTARVSVMPERTPHRWLLAGIIDLWSKRLARGAEPLLVPSIGVHPRRPAVAVLTSAGAAR